MNIFLNLKCCSALMPKRLSEAALSEGMCVPREPQQLYDSFIGKMTGEPWKIRNIILRK